MSQLPSGNGVPLVRGGRWLLAGWSLFLLAGFALATSVSPDPRGFGTHQQFGLPPCTLRMLAGVPCPSCGATTSFAHFVRGEWPSAIRANGAAFALACVCLVQIPWSWVCIAKGRLWSITRPERTLIITLFTLGSLFILQWMVWLTFGRN
ncbi:MAG: DUF2752 domain-containing protein [Planctomycetaceae bacterium]|nr:DUF2752 domain-containing protein [Planctomycetaceae bacterium]MCA9108559.1 DUF2752 domain-containing protein [Planctomycetaceae bacterium]